VSSASICRALGVAGVGAGASGRRMRECVQNGTKDSYEETSDTTAYSCRRVYLSMGKKIGKKKEGNHGIRKLRPHDIVIGS